MTVCKFGGSSVADAGQIRKVKAILDSDRNRRVIVVSAPGKRYKDDEKVTDLLYQCNSLVQKGGSCKPVFEKIEKRFLDIAKELKVDTKPLQMLLDDIRYQIDAGRGQDYAASRGEFLSAYVVSQFLGWEFVDAADAVIITGDGTVNPFSYDSLRMRLEDERRNYVVPGFYGSTEDGVIKTFTRGGSDITGSVVARSINADLYENWTDVSGMYAADPRVIKDAKVIDALNYMEVRELSDFGASVFHEEAIAPVLPVEIPINIKNTNRPEDPGTLIVPVSGEKGLAGVSVRGGLSRIRLRRLMLFKKHGTRHALLTMLHIFGVKPIYTISGVDSVVWFFDSRNAQGNILQAMCDRLKTEFDLDYVEVDHGHAVLGLVGAEIPETDAYVRALTALRDNGIAPTFVNFGASEVSVMYGIRDSEKEKALNVVYDELFR